MEGEHLKIGIRFENMGKGKLSWFQKHSRVAGQG